MTSRWSKQRREKRKYEQYLEEGECSTSASSGSRYEACITGSKTGTGSSSNIHTVIGRPGDSGDSDILPVEEIEPDELFSYNYGSDSSDSTGSDSDLEGEVDRPTCGLALDNLTTSSGSRSADFQIFLRNWAIKNQIRQTALRELLAHLKSQYDPQLPLDPRTLCNTPNLSSKIQKICGGEYYHFGLINALKDFLESLSVTERSRVSSISLKINCDGIPLYKSSGKQFWPLLVQFCWDYNTATSEPFPIGIFLGNSKPDDVKDYLKEFIDEILLLKNGYEFNNTKYLISIQNLICDAPARQYLKCIKSHSGYSSCERCQQHGKYDGTITFPELNAQIRTDENFASMSDGDHHKGPSPLLELDVGLVTRFVLDPMHLVYLGVMRKLLHLWRKGPLPTRIGSQSKERISANLVELAMYMPSEFSRKPRSLDDVERYKATEFRAFLLYTGPVCLLKIIDESIYKNFLLLSVSIHLLSVYKDSRNLEIAKKYLTAFIKHFEQLYGSRHLVYNVHNLIHLTEDVSNFGTIDKFSAFPFENYLGKLKRLLRKPNHPLSQVVNRIFEQKGSKSERKDLNYPIVKLEHSGGPLPDERSCKQFRALYLKDYCLRLDCANRGIMVNNQVGKVVNIVQYDTDPDIYVVYHFYKIYEDFYQYPLKSGSLGIYVVSHESKTLKVCSANDIKMKYILFPHDSKIVAFPLIHTCHQQ